MGTIFFFDVTAVHYNNYEPNGVVMLPHLTNKIFYKIIFGGKLGR